MQSKFGIFMGNLTAKLLALSDPYWWILISILLFILSMIHFLPLVLEDKNHRTKDHVLLQIRRVSVFLFVGVGLIYPLCIYVLFGIFNPAKDTISSQIFIDWALDMLARYWTAPLAGFLAGTLLNMLWHRYGEPYFSNLKRKYRVNQAEDKLSDVRKESNDLAAKNFNPEIYFKDGYYFISLDLENKPIYISDKIFSETHGAYVGPTGNGKGVLAGVILTQAIRKGHCVWMVDPKDDENLPYILQNEAKKAGRPFVYIDLNSEGKGVWHPFKGGTIRDRRTRMIAAFGLEKAGNNADVYKTKERGYVDKLLEQTDGSVKAMLDAINTFTKDDNLSSLRDGLQEWANISTFVPSKKKEGHSIEKSLLNDAVVYVRGSTGDGVVRAATKAYISELLQEAKRLHKQRKTHLVTFFDELRFVISNEVVDGLATIRTFKVNMNLATQSIGDLLNIQDSSINGNALKQSFEVNCQIKVLYKAGDIETAEWGEGLSGTTIKRVARNEKVEINRWGGEKWDNMRAFDNVEVPFMHRNVFLTLQPRVAVIYRPGEVATVAFTCWINTDRSFASWEKREQTSENVNETVIIEE